MKNDVNIQNTELNKWGVLFCVVLFGLHACQTKKLEDGSAKNLVADTVYTNAGKQLVARTFDTLRNSLLGAIQANGVASAISFCNESAYAITATYADSVLIRRTSLRVRNPDNNPDSLELLVLGEIEEEVKVSGIAESKIVRQQKTGEVHFFKPIMLQSMCLSCHGSPTNQIPHDAFARIEQLYPADKAVNYKEGDFRGVWHIVFKPKQ